MRLLISLLFLLTNSVFAFNPTNSNIQTVKVEYPNKHYTVHDGLVQMQVQTLYQDRKGYLWCGTKTGVSRFDGEKFKNFTSFDIKQNSPVVFFDEDEMGNLLIFSQNKLSILYPDSVRSIDFPEDFYLGEFNTKPFRHYSESISIISKKGENKPNNLLYYDNPDSMFVEDFNPGFGNKLHFSEKDPGLIWQIRNDSIFRVDIIDKKIVTSFKNPGIVVFSYLNNQWYGFSHNNGIFKLANNKFVRILKHKFGISELKCIHSPDRKSLIISSQQSLYKFENDQLTTLKSGMTLIRDILFDHEGNLWVASEEGLYNFFKLNFVNYTFGMGNKDWVWSIAEDANNNMWFTSFQNGIWKWDGENISSFTSFLNLKKKKQYGISYDYTYFMGASCFGNTVYFPTNYNVITFNGKEFGVVKGTNNTWNKAYFFTKTTSDSIFYCGGMSGLFEIAPKGENRSWSADSLGISTIMDAEIESNKNITVIGSSGIAKIRNDSIFYIEQNELRNNYCSETDHKGNIWIGANQELKLLSGDSLKNVVPGSTEHFFSLLFIKPHFLLIGGINGLYVANLNDYYQTGIFETVLYNLNNGFAGTECGQNGFFIDSKGFVWINTSNLVTRFDPKELIKNKQTTPNLFVSAKTSSDNIYWQTLATENKICLKYKQNNFRFNVDVISFSHTGNIRYYYQLKGLQNEWSEASSNNEVTFYNLKPGKYQFSAKVDPGVSKAMSETVTINFDIRKPYWLSWWFISCLAILILFLIFTIVILLNRRIRKQELIKKKIVQLRADALKAQMNPHLIYNALNNINGLINLGRKEQAQDFLNAFSDMLRLVLECTNQNEITLNNEFNILKSFIEFHKKVKAIQFNYEINSNTKESLNNILIPPMLIQPYVENAILHGIFKLKDRNGFIRIEAKDKNNRLIITVEDNGVGIGNSQHKGTGLGTKLTQERIQLLEKKQDNQVTISQLKKGTRIEINIPLKTKEYETY